MVLVIVCICRGLGGILLLGRGLQCFGLSLQFLGTALCHRFSLGTLLCLDQLFSTAGPGTLAEDLLHVVGENDLALHQELSQLGVTFLVLCQYLLGTLVLLVDHLQHLVVHDLGCGL